ncbi:MAG TPA: hypothetical protein DEA08_11795 [Planctomycetes bacterium]|nr:hypothetical protein [Planctomycetota bacterium]
MSGERPSQRLPSPGEAPRAEGRTLEQRAFLGTGTAFLLAAVAAAAELVWRLTSGRSPVIVVLPLLYLGLGWVSLLFGLASLTGEHRRQSAARGPWLALGALVIFLCAPIPASVLYPARERSKTFTCEECGTRAHAEGSQNYWGGWLEQRLRVLGRSPALPGQPWPQAPGQCEHPGYLPWED